MEENIIKDLIFNNVRPLDKDKKDLKIKIYYQNPKTNQLVIKNNLYYF